jgi:hypothetical protein
MKVVCSALVVTVAVAMGVIASGAAAVAAPTPSTTLTPAAIPGWAGYYSNDFEGIASTVVTVPHINCSGNPTGSFEGQAEGVQFLNDFDGSTGTSLVGAYAVVRTYCNGATATYDTAFFMPPPADNVTDYVPSSVAVRPGDRVLVSVTVSSTSSSASIRDLSRRSATSFAHGAAVTDAGPNIGIVALGLPSGGADVIGAPNGVSSVPPPVPSSTVSFTYSEAGGKALVDMPGLAAQEWTNSSDSSEVYAAPSPLSGGSNFAVSVPG